MDQAKVTTEFPVSPCDLSREVNVAVAVADADDHSETEFGTDPTLFESNRDIEETQTIEGNEMTQPGDEGMIEGFVIADESNDNYEIEDCPEESAHGVAFLERIRDREGNDGISVSPMTKIRLQSPFEMRKKNVDVKC